MPFNALPAAASPAPVGDEARSTVIAGPWLLSSVTWFSAGDAPVIDTPAPYFTWT